MKYRVVIFPSAQKEHRGVPSPFYEQIEESMLALGDQPRPPGCKKLKDSQDDWRIRVGRYRIVYEIDDKTRTVAILRVGHRKEIYR